MHGVFLHIMADALGSLVVILSAIIVKYIDPDTNAQWKFYVDPTLSIFLSVFIIVSTIPLLKESIYILMQNIPRDVDINNLRNKIIQIDHVSNLKNFHVWSLNNESKIASAQICLNKFDLDVYKNSVQNVKSLLNNHGIQSTTLQVEFEIDKK